MKIHFLLLSVMTIQTMIFVHGKSFSQNVDSCNDDSSGAAMSAPSVRIHNLWSAVLSRECDGYLSNPIASDFEKLPEKSKRVVFEQILGLNFCPRRFPLDNSTKEGQQKNYEQSAVEYRDAFFAGWATALYEANIQILETVLFFDKSLFEKYPNADEIIKNIDKCPEYSFGLFITSHTTIEKEYENIYNANRHLTFYHTQGYNDGRKLMSALLWKAGNEMRQFLVQDIQDDFQHLHRQEQLTGEEKELRKKNAPHLCAVIFLRKMIFDKIEQDRNTMKRIEETLKKISDSAVCGCSRPLAEPENPGFESESGWACPSSLNGLENSESRPKSESD